MTTKKRDFGPYKRGDLIFWTKAAVERHDRQEQRAQEREAVYRASLTMFQRWFVTFLEEKQVDLSEYADIERKIQYGDVCQYIMETTPEEQRKLKDMFCLIDFKNGSVHGYLAHLAQALPGPHPISISGGSC